MTAPDLKMFPILKNGQILINGSKINMAGGFPKEISLTLESFIFISGQEDLVDASAKS